MPIILVEDAGVAPSAAERAQERAATFVDAGPRSFELSASARTAAPGITRQLLDAIRPARACFGPSDPRGLRFTIDEAGHATDARDARGVRFAEPLASCVDRALGHATFPTPRGGAVTAFVPDDMLERMGSLRDAIVPCD